MTYAPRWNSPTSQVSTGSLYSSRGQYYVPALDSADAPLSQAMDARIVASSDTIHYITVIRQ